MRTHSQIVVYHHVAQRSKLSSLIASKRGADPNQIFIYIAAIVIVGFIFLYGFKAINTFMSSSEQIQLAKFIKDFQATASTVSTDFGSVQFLTVSIPSQFSRLCIVDLKLASTDACSSDNVGIKNNLTREICDSWDEQHADPTIDRQNVFFVSQDNTIGHADFIENIVITSSDGYLCTRDGKLRLEGEARTASVSIDSSSS